MKKTFAQAAAGLFHRMNPLNEGGPGSGPNDEGKSGDKKPGKMSYEKVGSRYVVTLPSGHKISAKTKHHADDMISAHKQNPEAFMAKMKKLYKINEGTTGPTRIQLQNVFDKELAAGKSVRQATQQVEKEFKVVKVVVNSKNQIVDFHTTDSWSADD